MVLSEAARSLIFTWSCGRGETGGCQLPRGRERPTEGTPEQGRLEPTTGATQVSIPQDLVNVTRGLGGYKPEGRVPSTKKGTFPCCITKKQRTCRPLWHYNCLYDRR